jgi:hypothetical protein
MQPVAILPRRNARRTARGVVTSEGGENATGYDFTSHTARRTASGVVTSEGGENIASDDFTTSQRRFGSTVAIHAREVSLYPLFCHVLRPGCRRGRRQSILVTTADNPRTTRRRRIAPGCHPSACLTKQTPYRVGGLFGKVVGAGGWGDVTLLLALLVGVNFTQLSTLNTLRQFVYRPRYCLLYNPQVVGNRLLRVLDDLAEPAFGESPIWYFFSTKAPFRTTRHILNPWYYIRAFGKYTRVG